MLDFWLHSLRMFFAPHLQTLWRRKFDTPSVSPIVQRQRKAVVRGGVLLREVGAALAARGASYEKKRRDFA